LYFSDIYFAQHDKDSNPVKIEGTPTRIATAKQPMPHELNTENNPMFMAEATHSLALRANLIRAPQQYRTGFVFQ